MIDVIFIVTGLIVGVPATIIFLKQSKVGKLPVVRPNVAYKDGLFDIIPLALVGFGTLMVAGSVMAPGHSIKVLLNALLGLSFFPLAYSLFFLLGTLGDKFGVWACWLGYGIFILLVGLLFEGQGSLVSSLQGVCFLFALLVGIIIADFIDRRLTDIRFHKLVTLLLSAIIVFPLLQITAILSYLIFGISNDLEFIYTESYGFATLITCLLVFFMIFNYIIRAVKA